jgi:hypothetical protein
MMSVLFLIAGLNTLNFGMGFKSLIFLERRRQDAASRYFETFEQLVKDSYLIANQTHNADETGVFWRGLPTSTLAGEGRTAAKLR